LGNNNFKKLAEKVTGGVIDKEAIRKRIEKYREAIFLIGLCFGENDRGKR